MRASPAVILPPLAIAAVPSLRNGVAIPGVPNDVLEAPALDGSCVLHATKASLLASTRLLDGTTSGPPDVPARGWIWPPSTFPDAPAVFLRTLVA